MVVACGVLLALILRIYPGWPASCVCSDLDGDSRREVALLIKGVTGSRVVVVDLGPRGLVLYSGLERGKPWRLSAGDCDGNGTPELLIGYMGATRFDPVVDKRPHIYRWDGGSLRPVWLGSRLAHPLVDAVLVPRAGGPCQLVSLERTREGGTRLYSYAWAGFGFEQVGQGPEFGRLARIAGVRTGRVLVVGTAALAWMHVARDGLYAVWQLSKGR